MGTVIGRIHAASERVPPELPRRDDLAIPARPALEEALADLRTPWPSGPYGEPARALLRERAPDVERRLLEHDELAVNVRQAPDHWVVTHGEPHRANVILDARGGVHLVDWDTTLVAPRERDLRMVLDQDLTGWDEYTAEAGAVPLRREVLGLYHEWWNLAEIAIY